MATRFCTCTWAISRLVPRSNDTAIENLPSAVEFDDMYSMFSTPLICCSIGVTTVAATTSALAPGYCPETLMIGGAISGYCATGSRENDTPPRITNTIETTAAKIGRSMKKCEMRIFLASASLGFVRPFSGRHAFLLRRHLLAGPRPHQAVDDDAIGGGKPVLDHAQPAVDLAERDVFLPYHIAVVDDQHEFAHLLGADRGVGNEQRGIGRRAGHADAAKHARGENAVGVVEDGAAADGARGAVDDVVDEIDLALVREILLVDQFQRDRNIAMKTGNALARRGKAHVTQIRCLVEREFDADRINRNDGGEQRGGAAGAAGDQIADGNPAVADAAVDRRTQFAILLEIELGRMHHRLLRGDGGFGDALGLGALVVSLLGDGLVAEELLAALQVGVGEGEIGARLRQIGLHLLEHDLERPAVDREEPIARKRSSTDSPAAKRPTYSSWSTTVRCTGLATVTAGGAAALCGCWPWPQPASASVATKAARRAAVVIAMNLSLKRDRGTTCHCLCQPQASRPSLAPTRFPYIGSTG